MKTDEKTIKLIFIYFYYNCVKQSMKDYSAFKNRFERKTETQDSNV